MADQYQQDSNNHAVFGQALRSIIGLLFGHALSTSLQLPFANGRIGMEVEIKTVHLLAPDLIATHCRQQWDLYPNAQQLLKLAMGPTRFRLTDQALDGLIQGAIARKMDIPLRIEPKAIE